MTFLIELDEGTAARRRVPIKLFTSDGTSPDTGASGDSLMYSVNGGAESDLTIVTITAADGMYYGEFAAADVDTLGTIALWHRDGSFPQHVANVNVVNFNPMSSQSNIPLVATVTDVTNQVTAAAIADAVLDEDMTAHQTLGSLGQAIGDPVADATTIYQAVVTDATGDNVAVDVVAVKAETALIVADTNELQTDDVPGLIAALNDIDGSEVTVHSGGIASTAFAAGAIDAASLSADAGAELADALLDRDMSTGADSGSSAVRTPRDALRALRNRVDLSGNTMTVFDEDDVTAAWTASLTTTADHAFPTEFDPNG